MIYGTLFTMPSATDIMASTSEYSSPLFTDFLPLIYLVLGVTLAVGLVIVLVSIGPFGKHH